MTEKALMNVALTMMAASIVLMLRSSVFVICAVLEVGFLRKKLYKHHLSAMGAIIIGTLIVCASYVSRY